MSRRRAAQQSGGNKPVASIALNAPSKVNSRETRSQKRKLAGIADNRELNAEQPEQPAKRSRRQTKESGLGSALAVLAYQSSRRQKNKTRPADLTSQPLQNVLKTPTLAPTTRRKMARIPSTAISQASAAMVESRTLEPAMPTTTIKIPHLARRGGPVLIQTDDEDEDNPSSKWLQAQQEFKDVQENDSDSESDMIGDIEDIEMLNQEFERENDSDSAAKYYAEEEARFTTQNRSEKTKKQGDMGTPSTLRRSEDNGLLLNLESEDIVSTHAPMTKKMQRIAARLVGELPVVSSDGQEMESPALALALSQSGQPAWLPHTNLVLKTSSDASWSYKLDLKSQNPQIRSVVKAATRKATLELVINGNECALHTAGLNVITLDALIKCADELGFDEDLDISHRLEDGDLTTYVQPLMKYVAQRVIIEQKTLKAGFSSVVLTAFGLDYSEGGIEEAKQLVANSDYIYQLSPSGTTYDYSRPFSHDVIHKYLSAALFSLTKYLKLIMSEKAKIFKSSLPQKPLELELPKAMVAMEACVRLLAGCSVAPTEHGLSQDQILQRINLAAFAANGNDDDSSLLESDLDQRASQDAQRAITAFSGVDGNATLDSPGSSNGDGPSDDRPGNDGDGSGDNGEGSGGNGDGSASDVHNI
ncbi:MAG: hypothetical protein NXY57DRAFT_961744 [Lentinula lateritia]|nr:MAG: hypothetical protein NXY57DRAFT_961744 [Lentinula lateritia]